MGLRLSGIGLWRFLGSFYLTKEYWLVSWSMGWVYQIDAFFGQDVTLQYFGLSKTDFSKSFFCSPWVDG